MRGAVQANLSRQCPFWKANILTSLLFVLLTFRAGSSWECCGRT